MHPRRSRRGNDVSRSAPRDVAAIGPAPPGGLAVSRPLPIAVLGLDDRRLRVLEMVLSGPAENCCVVVPDDAAQAVVLDLDGPGADDDLAAQRRRHPHRPLVLLALRPVPPQVLGRDLQVLKPVQVKELVAALREVCTRAVHAPAEPPPDDDPVATAPSVDDPVTTAPPLDDPVPAGGDEQPGPPSARARLFVVPDPPGPAPGPPAEPEPVLPQPLPPTHYDPDRYLQGLVARACRDAVSRDQAVHVDGLWPTITLLPNAGTAIVAGGRAALDPHAGVPDLLSNARLTFTPAPRFNPNHPDAMPLEALVWQLALAASRGRLPIGTPVDQPCALRGWPNSTRLAPAPGAMAITALWSQGPATLLETAEVLRLPHSYVFSCYSAVSALGLLVADPAPTPPPARCPTEPAAPPGMLRRAFARLRIS